MKELVTLPSEGFVRLRDILRVLPLSKSSWWAGVKSGRFPPPRKLGPNTTVWRVEDNHCVARWFRDWHVS